MQGVGLDGPGMAAAEAAPPVGNEYHATAGQEARVEVVVNSISELAQVVTVGADAEEMP